ncbi:hypothetical protein ATE67_13850 [Sphingopyxis sp. H050]|nr:hypothetical protein ATE67_13850 [Sphingopyxis sp. H050]
MPKSPPWTQEERAILAELYPTQGLNGAADALADRSWAAIHQMAHKMGLKTSHVAAAPKAKLQGTRLAEAVRLREDEKWSFARIGATFGVSEAAACNAVMIALCERTGHRPATRDQYGRLVPAEIERLRLMLRKGLKGIDIQLRMGISAARVAEERRRYNRELKANGKAPLQPPGAGAAYSGVKLSKATRAEVEALFLQGLGTLKISERTGASKTSCTRIRARLVKRLARKGETLPGCDAHGTRHTQAESARFITDSQRDALRRLLLDGWPCARAARFTVVGNSSAYRIRDELAAELARDGKPPLQPRFPGKSRHGLTVSPHWPPTGVKQIYAFRQLLATMSFDEAKAQWRQQKRDEATRPRTFEEQLAAVRAGAKIVERQPIRKADPTYTLGGVATGAL